MRLQRLGRAALPAAFLFQLLPLKGSHHTFAAAGVGPDPLHEQLLLGPVSLAPCNNQCLLVAAPAAPAHGAAPQAHSAARASC